MTATPPRSIRVPDDLWDACRERAATEGTTISEVILDALSRYAERRPPYRTTKAKW